MENDFSVSIDGGEQESAFLPRIVFHYFFLPNIPERAKRPIVRDTVAVCCIDPEVSQGEVHRPSHIGRGGAHSHAALVSAGSLATLYEAHREQDGENNGDEFRLAENASEDAPFTRWLRNPVVGWNQEGALIRGRHERPRIAPGSSRFYRPRSSSRQHHSRCR